MMSLFVTGGCSKFLRLFILSVITFTLIHICTVKAGKTTKLRNKQIVHPRTAKPHSERTKSPSKRATEGKQNENKPVWYRPYRISKTGKTRNDLIEDAILNLPEFHKLLKPLKRRGNMKKLIQRSNYAHLLGTVRRKRLYCRVGIGYHLVITAKGKVRTRHKATANGLMEIFSVKRSVIGIRSAVHKNRYLCMNKRGKIFTRKHFRSDCHFRENLERNHFNTYASEKYSNHESRKGYFLAINRNGKIPSRMKKTSWKQKRTHWLPRNVSRKKFKART